MTLQNLKDQIDTLCEYYNDGGTDADNVEVRVAIQPNYPLTSTLKNICTFHKTEKDEDDEIWLAIGDGIGYDVPNGIWDNDDVYAKDSE